MTLSSLRNIKNHTVLKHIKKDLCKNNQVPNKFIGLGWFFVPISKIISEILDFEIEILVFEIENYGFIVSARNHQVQVI